MKKLTKTELKEISETLNNDPYFMFHKRLLQSKFSVGDVLIKRYQEFYDGASEPINCGYDDDAPGVFAIRGLVVHVDEETGIPFVKEYNENGDLEDDINPCINADDSEFDSDGGHIYFWEVDPAFVNATIVDEKFDIKELFKVEQARKDQVLSIWQSTFTSVKNEADAEAFAKTLSPGQTLYLYEDPRNTYEAKLTFDDIRNGFETYMIQKIEFNNITPPPKKRGSSKAQRLNPSALRHHIGTIGKSGKITPTSKKTMDKLIASFFSDLEEEQPHPFIIHTVCGEELTAENLMNYLIYLHKPPETSSNI